MLLKAANMSTKSVDDASIKKVANTSGLSKRDFIDKLDDRLLQLRSDRQAPQSTIDAHNEYRLAKAGGARQMNWSQNATGSKT